MHIKIFSTALGIKERQIQVKRYYFIPTSFAKIKKSDIIQSWQA